jgi:hypothetical protein
MNLTAIELSAELRRLVDHRLDAIEQILVQNQTPRAERRSILEDIETQILEMVSAEASNHEPTRADLLRVFSKLDPPEAFSGDQAESARPNAIRENVARTISAIGSVAKPTYTPIGILACIGGLTTLILAFPCLILAELFADSESVMFYPAGAGFLAVVGIPAMVLGILYAIAIRNSRGQLRGLTCAAIGISALPIVVGFVAAYFLVAAVSTWGMILSGFVIVVLAIVGCIHLTYRSLELFVGALSRRGERP